MNIKKKRFISLVVIGSLIFSFIAVPFKTHALNKDSNTEKSYVVVYEDGASRKVDTINLNPYEAAKMEQERDVLVVEEDGLVYGSGKKNDSNLKDFYSKDKHEKKVKKKSSKNSDVEWNMQVIKADNITAEDLYDESVVTGPAFNVVTGPAINTITDSKVKVAIIDSGVDYSEDVDVYMRKNFIPGEDDVSIIYEDGLGHGTSVSGIIAAKDNDIGITGINPDVELYSAKVLDRNNTAPVSRVVEAIYWAIDNDVNIINISFGTTHESAALEQAIQDAYDAGILLIAAAGNNGTIEYPAAYDEVIAVGSVDSKGKRSKGSATGEDLELMAPENRFYRQVILEVFWYPPEPVWQLPMLPGLHHCYGRKIYPVPVISYVNYSL
ncbi:S8 family serine peptidase [Anaerocolumna sedimenticola]|uniref:S8 family serine peptidase n=1 Tax=Anaerocolumna sedimenticola TaxID=2696063 RepID=A0A6P1THV4_9FIRM|nr:S8 family serine peptidase [Anaerocolumna sedimenticola]QHQ59506.1 S8 family serine peptidase [Anaerocolumna sedimenticola]